MQTRAKLTEKHGKSIEQPFLTSSVNDGSSTQAIIESDKPPPGLLDEAVDESARADAELLAAHGYNFTDDDLREEGFAREWEFARERARRAALLRAGGHWERMSSSLHLYYGWGDEGLTEKGDRPNRWLYADFISTKVANHEYYATLVHRLGYVGYQSKQDGGKKYSQFQCSNWDSKGHNAQSKSDIKFCGKGVTCKRFGHEGSGWQTHIEVYDIIPEDGGRFAFAVNYEDAGNGKNQVTCWFKAPGFNNGKWFKQSVWVGPGGGGHGTTATSFLEQFRFDQAETSKIREGLYGTIWGRDSWGPWKVMKKASSSCEPKVKEGWKKVNWGVKAGSDGQERWYLSACGCKNTWECPGQEACTLTNTGGGGKKSISPPTEKPPSLKEFEGEVEAYLPAPPPAPPIPGTQTGTCEWVKHVGKSSQGYAAGVSTQFKTPEEAMQKCIELGKGSCKAVLCNKDLTRCSVRGGNLIPYDPETCFTLDDYNCDMSAKPAPTPAPTPPPALPTQPPNANPAPVPTPAPAPTAPTPASNQGAEEQLKKMDVRMDNMKKAVDKLEKAVR